MSDEYLFVAFNQSNWPLLLIRQPLGILPAKKGPNCRDSLARTFWNLSKRGLETSYFNRSSVKPIRQGASFYNFSIDCCENFEGVVGSRGQILTFVPFRRILGPTCLIFFKTGVACRLSVRCAEVGKEGRKGKELEGKGGVMSPLV